MKKFLEKMKFPSITRILAGFIVITIVLLAERRGLGVTAQNENYQKILPVSENLVNKEVAQDKTCLYLWNSTESTSSYDQVQFSRILEDMRIPTDQTDLASDMMPELGSYRTIWVGMSSLDVMGDYTKLLLNYVNGGGQVLFACPLDKSTYTSDLMAALGIAEVENKYSLVDSFHPMDGFMIGGDGQTYKIEDGYESSMNVELSDTVKVYATSTSEGGTPLIWENTYGAGKFVMCNFGYCEKAYRGIYAAAYSLLDQACVYPVIGASAFYLDDFPSPVPAGDSTYISRDYNMDVAAFYSNVWWPDLLKLEEKYGVRYTGLIIETYEDKTYGELSQSQETSNYYYYGNMLLNHGGELGYHGYNHQPLCGPDFVYTAGDEYNTWESNEEMLYAMQSIQSFAQGIFPKEHFTVYVPPSNILSDEGRAILGSGKIEDLRAVASCYLPSGDAYDQEFEVAADGMVETPRVISGGIMDDYTRMTAMCELNFHYVNSHFMHPDDLLDVDRGAKLGWKVLKSRIEDYMKWLKNSAKGIDETTGAGMAAAVQRFATVTPSVTYKEGAIEISLDHFYDQASLMIRLNDGEPGEVTGGDLTHVNGNLYLLRANQKNVVIEYK